MVFAGAVAICIDVVGRWLFGLGLRGTFELNGYALAIATSWSLGYALLKRAHIRVDVVYARFPRKVRRWLDLLSLGILAVMAGTLMYRGWGVLATSYSRNTSVPFSIHVEIWGFQAAWIVGLLAFFLVTLFLLVSVARALLGGRLDEVERLAGAFDVKDEIEEELDGVRSRMGRSRGEAA